MVSSCVISHIDHTLTDREMFSAFPVGNEAMVLYFGSATINLVAAAAEEMGNVLLLKCLKTTANWGVKEKVK